MSGRIVEMVTTELIDVSAVFRRLSPAKVTLFFTKLFDMNYLRGTAMSGCLVFILPTYMLGDYSSYNSFNVMLWLLMAHSYAWTILITDC
jgi:Na+/H+ antiporter NhaA